MREEVPRLLFLAFMFMVGYGGAAAGKQTLIVPDKDADGLAAGAIIRKPLILLGLDSKLISCYTMTKNSLLHCGDSRANMEAYNPSYIIVLDQGSWKSEPVVDSPHRALVIDQHLAEDDDHPKGAILVTANKCPPIATSWLLTYLICRDLHDGVEESCGWLCAMGTHGDLVIRIKSKAQIHALIAERQTRQLFSRDLQVVMIANEGYARGIVNYSCRVPTCARGRDPPVNIPEILSRAADGADDDTLRERLGPRFAVGHKNASGGMIPQAAFEDFLEAIGVSSDKKPSPSPKKSPKSSTNQE
ncbi:uncharacterized protein FPRO_14305 [Fusarium proliferatum ET1]|uniref:DDH domain-containing protein n=1 Tax=Fusarium proliferatum (strain ET1) TaxID=1227346 RepID=A0A1L7VWR1_FUSPR|nr:uncharacterized protein FPRO_14305 [Fusarium proliferatum ET1]CZR44552.1 uncharacterized protein FPRO_14305 [Fusarium proliferatum ET1]